MGRGNTLHAVASWGDNNINRWYGPGGEESPSTAITRRYYPPGRPCPNDGIIKPAASLGKKKRD